MTRRSMLGGIAAIGIMASVLWARPGVVKTKDGRTIEGDIIESVDKPDQITVSAHGAQLSIERSNIASLDYTGNVEDEYKRRLAKLGANATAADHLTLASWLFNQKAYDQARIEATAAKKINPQDPNADALIVTINRQQLLDRTQATGTGATGTGTTTVGPVVTPPKPGARHLLTPEQIQTIKQGEMKTDDVGLKPQFTNKVITRYIDFDNVAPADFATNTPFQQAVLILTRGTPEMRQDVKFSNDPSAVEAYKKIQPMLLAGCATSGCHNEQSKTKFLLFTGSEPDVVYTNFYILTQYATTVDKVQHKLVDRTRPNESLLLQFGLPRDRAQFPHKDVVGMRTPFTSAQVGPYQTILNWISNILLPTADYKVEYQIPSGATTQPATAPAPAGVVPPPAPAVPAPPAAP